MSGRAPESLPAEEPLVTGPPLFGVPYRWVALSLAAFVVFLSTIDVSIVNIALPTLAEEFDTTTDAVVWAPLVFILIGTGLSLPLGRMGDLYGRKRLFVGGQLLVTLGLALSSVANSLPTLIAARAVQGVGSAMVIANSNAIVTASFPASQRGRALGTIGAVVGAGLASGPVLGGVLVDLLDWRAIFWVRIPFAALAALVLWKVLRDTPTNRGAGRVDILGSLALFAMLASLTVAVNRGSSWGWMSPSIVGLFATGVLMVPAFIWIERRVPSPVVALALFRRWSYAGSLATAVLFFWGFAAVFILMPFYLVEARGFSTLQSGAILAAQPLALFVFAPFTGRLSDRYGPQHFVTAALAISALGLLLLATIDAETPVWAVVARMSLLGLGLAMFQSPNNSTVMGSVPAERLGQASASIVTARRIGQSIGIAASGAIFTVQASAFANSRSAIGLDDPAVQPDALVHGLEVALLVAAGVSFVAVLVWVAGNMWRGWERPSGRAAAEPVAAPREP